MSYYRWICYPWKAFRLKSNKFIHPPNSLSTIFLLDRVSKANKTKAQNDSIRNNFNFILFTGLCPLRVQNATVQNNTDVENNTKYRYTKFRQVYAQTYYTYSLFVIIKSYSMRFSYIAAENRRISLLGSRIYSQHYKFWHPYRCGRIST